MGSMKDRKSEEEVMTKSFCDDVYSELEVSG